eukprot:m.44532 g.44532  ORF g.44532 m.44532 type:complete len:500 (+) comp10838_c0_seq2:443-1942(+)
MGLKELKESGGLYAIYILIVLLFVYLTNQLDRYLLGIVSTQTAQALHYGDQGCLKLNQSNPFDCAKFTNESTCPSLHCQWNYTGSGMEYQLLAGPAFTVIYTFAGIPISAFAARCNRKYMLTVFVAVWSIMTLCMGLSQKYWELLLARLGQGAAQAGCTPYASGIIGDLFPAEYRGTAMGIYNWGIYTGYSLSYALGNFMQEAKGWRFTFYMGAVPGALAVLLLLLTVHLGNTRAGRNGKDKALEDDEGASEEEKEDGKGAIANAQEQNMQKEAPKKRTVWSVLVYFFTYKSLLLLCLAGAVRNAGGYVWALNTELFFQDRGQTTKEIGTYMSWIPLVAGSLGAVFGGFISDRIVKKRGTTARIWVLVISNLLAAPFAAGALFLDFPLAYISLIPCNIIGEMWIGVTLTIVMEMVPEDLRTLTVSVYLFIITNIGGNANILIPPLKKVVPYKWAVFIMYPGMYCLGALLFLLTLFLINRDKRRQQEKQQGERQPLIQAS